MLESLLESYEKEKASLEKEGDECHKQLEQAESQSQNTEHFIKLRINHKVIFDYLFKSSYMPV